MGMIPRGGSAPSAGPRIPRTCGDCPSGRRSRPYFEFPSAITDNLCTFRLFSRHVIQCVCLHRIRVQVSLVLLAACDSPRDRRAAAQAIMQIRFHLRTNDIRRCFRWSEHDNAVLLSESRLACKPDDAVSQMLCSRDGERDWDFCTLCS